MKDAASTIILILAVTCFLALVTSIVAGRRASAHRSGRAGPGGIGATIPRQRDGEPGDRS